MWITYSDKEVQSYHPVCKTALEKALCILELNDTYEVLHHQLVGTLEMDFVIQNKETSRILCVIEVKRTIAAVNSARYQLQAMSYVQMLSPSKIERPYYMLTNLECSCLFRYDNARVSVFQQMLKPGILCNSRFDDVEEEVFKDNLSKQYAEFIKSMINDEYEYTLTLSQFVDHINNIKNNASAWKSSLAILLYEYIRGVFISVGRNDLKDIRKLNQQINAVCREASVINFSAIFGKASDEYDAIVKIPAQLLNEMFAFGESNSNADEIASAMHHILSEGHEHDGEVPTDLELAEILLVLSSAVCPSIKENRKICDPAAGSGNLLSCITSVYNTVEPKQLVANDKNKYLLELLSLRLGLKFPLSICKTNSPTITAFDICELDKSYFTDVELILMNPPFVSAIYSLDRRTELYNRICDISKKEAITNIGQMPLEGPFIELILNYITDGTTVACIIPKSHLTARGDAAVAIRQFFLKEFGLQLVCTYPGLGIFDSVTKDTVIIVGKKGSENSSVKFISIYDQISDVDLKTLKEGINMDVELDKATSIGMGLEVLRIEHNKLQNMVEDGWRLFNQDIIDAMVFINNKIATSDKFVKMSDLNYNFKRGKVGNKGLSDLLYISSLPTLLGEVESIVKDNIYPGLRNAKHDNIFVDDGDRYFLDIKDIKNSNLKILISKYREYERSASKQARKHKSDEEIIKILQTESNYITSENSILIPRNIRKKGRVYYCNKATYVSTNFFIIDNASEKQAKILSSWISTVFYQLNCEISAKNQDGTRKMEEADIMSTYAPNIGNLTDYEIDEILSVGFTEFIDLQNPQSREVDKIWAKILWGSSYECFLDKAISLLSTIALVRNA